MSEKPPRGYGGYKVYYDQGKPYYVTPDGDWIWDSRANGPGNRVGDWIPNETVWGKPKLETQNQSAGFIPGNTERTVDSMYIWNIAAVKLTSVVEQQQGKSSELLASGQVIAKEQNIAVALFGAKHADALEGVSADLLQITVRQGV